MKELYNSSEEKIRYNDGVESTIYIHQPIKEFKKLVLILPALGVRVKFYVQVAQSFATNEIGVLCLNWRGYEKDGLYTAKRNDWGTERLLSDIDELYQYVTNLYSDKLIYILGHSYGGQLALLFNSKFELNIKGIILIATCCPYHKGWDGLKNLKMRILGISLPILVKTIGYFPGRLLGFAGTEAKTIMEDWSYTIRTGIYKLSHSAFDYESALRHNNFKPSILSILIEGDEMAPKKANEILLSKINCSSIIKHEILTDKISNSSKSKHFSWAKKPDLITSIINKWIQEKQFE